MMKGEIFGHGRNADVIKYKSLPVYWEAFAYKFIEGYLGRDFIFDRLKLASASFLGA